MPTYEITIPGSGIYRVESPTKLTDDQAYQEALKQSTPRTTGQQIKQVLGVAARGAAPGACLLLLLLGRAAKAAPSTKVSSSARERLLMR